jgi:hypothetical protein
MRRSREHRRRSRKRRRRKGHRALAAAEEEAGTSGTVMGASVVMPPLPCASFVSDVRAWLSWLVRHSRDGL